MARRGVTESCDTGQNVPNLFSRYRLRPRVLVDVSKVDTGVELFGGWAEFPICVAPTAMQKMAHSDGEIANAKGIDL